ncbi:MAG: Single-stranded DNA-binding protein [Chlamydiae bacterium]|nr:Single-stranded DNA-binding protein [Chlamydiota bacterium]
MNTIYIAGHLGADPETRFTANGQKVTTLRVATRSRRSGKDETIWWRVTVWGDQYDKMITYLKKGSPLMVFGDMHKPEIYTDKNGNPQVSLSLTALQLSFSPFGRSEQKEDNEPSKDKKEEEAFASLASVVEGTEEKSEESDDDLPF